jgi:hypothetical protein
MSCTPSTQYRLYLVLDQQRPTYSSCSINNSINAKAETLISESLLASRLVFRVGRHGWESRQCIFYPGADSEAQRVSPVR